MTGDIGGGIWVGGCAENNWPDPGYNAYKGIKVLSNIGSYSGWPSNYCSGILIDGYYQLGLACYGDGDSTNLYWKNNSSVWREIIHSGNIGSQSVNYATSAGNTDTVDGYHASSFL